MKSFNENWDGIQRKISPQLSEAKNPFPTGFNKGEMLKKEEAEITEENESPPTAQSPTSNAKLPNIAIELAKKKLKRHVVKTALIAGGVEAVTGVAKRQLVKTSIKLLGKKTAKILLTKIPVLGLGLGIVFASNRLAKGEYVKAAIELVAGVASTIPGFGTAVAVLCDIALMTGDFQKLRAIMSDFKEVQNDNMTPQEFQKKYNLEKLNEQFESGHESIDLERWNQIDFAVNEMIRECGEIDSILESLDEDNIIEEEETI
jgi:hypothetical protein